LFDLEVLIPGFSTVATGDASSTSNKRRKTAVDLLENAWWVKGVLVLLLAEGGPVDE
jgi:cytochrome c oxidase assembly factor CtaG